MSRTAISVENLGKAYRLGIKEHIPDTLVGAAKSWVRSPFQNFQRLRSLDVRPHEVDSDDVLWALKDVSFTVNEGEVVGVIGHNGAGKSTLLKILSRITEPTAGIAKIHGRVASLLEVGTGFHPELTGRENVYLNGTILGMTKREIDGKFDEIVTFSGVEKFLDTPVKRYSSGMKVRLAFAVAAHLDPEILVIDEVLAVGDVEFQRKCLDKMQSVSREGRTVLFVSHNLGAMQLLCERGIILNHGKVHTSSSIEDAISTYLRLIDKKSGVSLVDRADRRGTGEARLSGIQVTGGTGQAAERIVTGAPARFDFHYQGVAAVDQCTFTIYDSHGQPVACFDSNNRSPNDSAGKFGVVTCSFESLLLLPGRYRINAALRRNGVLLDHIEGACFFDVESGLILGRPAPSFSGYGSVTLPHMWAGAGMRS